MDTIFDLTPNPPSPFHRIVAKDELFVMVAWLISNTFAFEVINLEDGNFYVEYRSKNDNDVCLLRDYQKV
jgi:hypothetical protein